MRAALQVAAAVTVSGGLYTAALACAPIATPLILFVPLAGIVLAACAPAVYWGLWLLLTAGVVSLSLGPLAAWGFVLPLGLPSLVLARGMRRTWPFERTVLAGVAAWLAGVIGVSALAYGDSTALVVATRGQIAQGVNLALSTTQPIGVEEPVVAGLSVESERLITALTDFLPALVVLTGGLAALLNLLLLRRWTGVYNDVNLRLWRTPDVLIWALIVAGFGMFVPIALVAVAARNAFVILLGCYFCQGLAVVSYYLMRFRVPPGVRIAGYLLIAVHQLLTAVVVALGVFDLWGDFRRVSVGTTGTRLDTNGE